MLKISIIIPFCDKVDFLNQCVSSILNKSTYRNFEIILVNNNSEERKTLDYLVEIRKTENVNVLEYSRNFNFSAINNFAVRHAQGELILFLNNDTSVISSDWLEEMLKCFGDKKTGVVGAKLLYLNNTIQHCGVMLEEKRIAIHAFRAWKEAEAQVDDRKEWLAVTGACMMTRKDLFLRLGGFDEENLPIAYNDVDYCLRAGELGIKTLCVSNIKLYHAESVSRKSDIFARFVNRKRYGKFISEQKYIRKRWEKEILADPFYNKAYI